MVLRNEDQIKTARKWCQGETKSGEPCKAPTIKNANWCLFHHPGDEWVKVRKENQGKGGRRGRYTRPIDIDPEKNVEHYVSSVRAFIEDIQSRSASSKRDNLLAKMLGEYRQSIELAARYSGLADRVKRLEENR